jgi:hypothetical protein
MERRTWRLLVNFELTNSYRMAGRSLVLARLGWAGVALLVLVPTLLSWPWYYNLLRQVCETCLLKPGMVDSLSQMGVDPRLWTAWKFASNVLVGGGWIGAGMLIFALRSSDRRAILMSVFLMLVGPGFGGIPSDLAVIRPEFSLVHRSYIYLATVGFLGLVLLFPNGRLAPRWSLWPVLYLLVLFFPNSVMYGSRFDFATWPISARSLLLFSFLLGTLIGVPLHRYRRNFSPAERQQARWAMLGFIAAAFGIILTMLTATVLLPCTAVEVVGPSVIYCGFTQSLGYGLSPMMIPIFIGVAVLRSRLWDIDVIIRRTLVYTLLSLTLGLIYLGVVVILQNLLGELTGERQPEIVTVISTLAIAALFTPLRQHIQNFIDQRFYRRKYNAKKALAAFASLARQETNLDELKVQVVSVVQETVQPEHASLWLHPAEKGK